jgi:hypothetical protein
MPKAKPTKGITETEKLFTAQDKIEVLDILHANQNNLKVAAKLTGVPATKIAIWQSTYEKELQEVARNDNKTETIARLQTNSAIAREQQNHKVHTLAMAAKIKMIERLEYLAEKTTEIDKLAAAIKVLHQITNPEVYKSGNQTEFKINATYNRGTIYQDIQKQIDQVRLMDAEIIEPNETEEASILIPEGNNP